MKEPKQIKIGNKKGINKFIIFFIAMILLGCTIADIEEPTDDEDNLSSSDTTLSYLTISEGVLTPDFDPSITSYSAVVEHKINLLNITAEANYDESEVSIHPSSQINLSVGSNSISITVTAKDGSSKDYIIIVTREDNLSTSFNITYYDNNSDSGTVPLDETLYDKDDTILIAENTGNLEKAGMTWVGWNTRSDGTGDTWLPGECITVGNESIEIYANWKPYFDPADKPDFERITFMDDNIERRYKILKPWNYDENKEYPLLISLHGASSTDPDTEKYLTLGVYTNDLNMQAYPCYIIAPSSNYSDHGWGSNAAWVRDLIESIIASSDYSIDMNRIYIAGYSMGGAGSYQFAQEYFNEYNRNVAGILRLSGSSTPEMSIEIIERCGIWYFVESGWDLTLKTSQEAYDYAKTVFPNAQESLFEDVLQYNSTSYFRTTEVLIENDIELFKRSTFEDVKHKDIQSIPWKDPMVYRWLFQQDLEKRP